jgi:hypothetical protein
MRYGVDTLPHVRCIKKTLGVCWGLVDKISPAFELKLGCAGSRQVIPAVCHRLGLKRASSSVPGVSAGHCVPLTCLCVAPPGQSPAYTYLKQPWQPLQVFALSQSLLCLLLRPILTYNSISNPCKSSIRSFDLVRGLCSQENPIKPSQLNR